MTFNQMKIQRADTVITSVSPGNTLAIAAMYPISNTVDIAANSIRQI